MPTDSKDFASPARDQDTQGGRPEQDFNEQGQDTILNQNAEAEQRSSSSLPMPYYEPRVSDTPGTNMISDVFARLRSTPVRPSQAVPWQSSSQKPSEQKYPNFTPSGQTRIRVNVTPPPAAMLSSSSWSDSISPESDPANIQARLQALLLQPNDNASHDVLSFLHQTLPPGGSSVDYASPPETGPQQPDLAMMETLLKEGIQIGLSDEVLLEWVDECGYQLSTDLAHPLTLRQPAQSGATPTRSTPPRMSLEQSRGSLPHEQFLPSLFNQATLQYPGLPMQPELTQLRIISPRQPDFFNELPSFYNTSPPGLVVYDEGSAHPLGQARLASPTGDESQGSCPYGNRCRFIHRAVGDTRTTDQRMMGGYPSDSPGPGTSSGEGYASPRPSFAQSEAGRHTVGMSSNVSNELAAAGDPDYMNASVSVMHAGTHAQAIAELGKQALLEDGLGGSLSQASRVTRSAGGVIGNHKQPRQATYDVAKVEPNADNALQAAAKRRFSLDDAQRGGQLQHTQGLPLSPHRLPVFSHLEQEADEKRGTTAGKTRIVFFEQGADAKRDVGGGHESHCVSLEIRVEALAKLVGALCKEIDEKARLHTIVEAELRQGVAGMCQELVDQAAQHAEQQANVRKELGEQVEQHTKLRQELVDQAAQQSEEQINAHMELAGQAEQHTKLRQELVDQAARHAEQQANACRELAKHAEQQDNVRGEVAKQADQHAKLRKELEDKKGQDAKLHQERYDQTRQHEAAGTSSMETAVGQLASSMEVLVGQLRKKVDILKAYKYVIEKEKKELQDIVSEQLQ
eukprot:gene14820-20873_t